MEKSGPTEQVWSGTPILMAFFFLLVEKKSQTSARPPQDLPLTQLGEGLEEDGRRFGGGKGENTLKSNDLTKSNNVISVTFKSNNFRFPSLNRYRYLDPLIKSLSLQKVTI